MSGNNFEQFRHNILSIFSHELRTPLNSVINFSYHISKKLNSDNFDKESIKEKVDLIHESATNMNEMLESILEAVKFEYNEIEIQKVDYDISLSIQSVFSSYDFDGYDIEQRITPNVIINSDISLMEQLLSHILSNIKKYSNKKAIITLEDSKEMFLLTFEDNGSGINLTENTFSLFAQGEQSLLKRENDGIGIGLFVIKKVCDFLNYKIDISSSDELGGAKIMISGLKK
jgi:K+-sensing histidine kinase KdpD